MTEETAVRIAVALESIAVIFAAFLPEAEPEPQERIYQTQEGPLVMRDGRLVPLTNG